MPHKFTFIIHLRNGGERQASYEEIIRALSWSDESFICGLISDPLPENALYLGEILKSKFYQIIQDVKVCQDGVEI